MRFLSTERVISSFEALLSTDLSGSYSQGLIHRNLMNEETAGSGKPLRAEKSARHSWKEITKEGSRQVANGPVCE
jgi:hypothetical protein